MAQKPKLEVHITPMVRYGLYTSTSFIEGYTADFTYRGKIKGKLTEEKRKWNLKRTHPIKSRKR